ncbi:MAG: hypothetical protein IPM20_04040 [Gammaproteobacteria bacterium]|nr:hypothetical protein [Gammaproteobacteria bacterium]
MKIRYFPTQGEEPIVINVSTEFEEEIPRWDVAIEALVREEFQKQRRALQIEDFYRLAQQYAIRFDDMMATVFELVINGKWIYMEDEGSVRHLRRDEVSILSAQGRLQREDVKKFTGFWRPLH